MRTLREWIFRFWGTIRRKRLDQDLEEELRLHCELAAEDMRKRGASAEDAARMARLRAGGAAHSVRYLTIWGSLNIATMTRIIAPSIWRSWLTITAELFLPV